MVRRAFRAPRRSSMGYRRKRANSRKPYVRAWPDHDEDPIRILGFPGFKAGMTRVIERVTNPRSHIANTQRIQAVTVIETPPAILYGIRAYKQTPYGLKILKDIIINSPSRFYKRRRRYPEVNNREEQIDEMYEVIDQAAEVRAIVHTQPDLTGIGTKTPETFEIKIGGPANDFILDWAIERLGQELQIEDFASEGQYLDVIGITKGKGFQGVVKRHGITKLHRKARDGSRRVGSIGPWTPARLRWNIPRYGQMGYNRRTEYNKRVMKLGVEGSEVNPAGGFVKYGEVKNRYVLLKGSVPGPKKRIVMLREGMRAHTRETTEPNLTYVSQISQQR